MEKIRRRLGQQRVSERRACRALGQPRSTQRYRAKRSDMDRRLLEEMRHLVASYPRYGSERVHQLLVGTGWRVNFKRVHRLWKQEHLQVPRKQRKRRRLPGSSAHSCVRYKARYPNHVWSYDFLTDRTEDGRQVKLLAVIDEFTRECLAIEVGRTFTARDVILTLQYLFAVRGAPGHLRSPALAGGRSSLRRRFGAGWIGRRSLPCMFRRRVLGRTDTWKASTAGCAMSC